MLDTFMVWVSVTTVIIVLKPYKNIHLRVKLNTYMQNIRISILLIFPTQKPKFVFIKLMFVCFEFLRRSHQRCFEEKLVKYLYIFTLSMIVIRMKI